MILVWFFVVYSLTLPPKCSAQVLYGSLTGTVTEPSGAAMAGANVEALNVGTGTIQQSTTDNSGIYRFTALLPGTYKVTITVPNFDTQVTDGVRVDVNAVQRVDAHLKVRTAAQSVTVTAEAPLLQSDRADVRSHLNRAQIQSLPSISSEGRSFQALYKIIPGASLPRRTTPPAETPSAR